MADRALQAVYLIGLIAGSAIRIYYTRRARKRRIAVRRETRLDRALLNLPLLGMVLIPLLYILTPWLDFADYSLPGWSGGTGAAIFAAALILLWRSHADLGACWTPVLLLVEHHRLVTRGVYRYIRHPMYAAHWLWAIAQPLLLQNWIAGPAMFLTFLPLYLVRVGREEEMLLEEFGEDYRVYMHHTGRLLPRLWR
ncbi:MAG: protein-S-isoprenylcysteine O-methyltransferase [Methanomicrobiales archaeon]|nr:protein-S-isoprenylcysteine O-methyltransferase [Methanomicrobiales archaeon]MDI6876059.1 protein-S-isoprenylcysteine O-methyltransferase [Methanomicrobiales archaeon]